MKKIRNQFNTIAVTTATLALSPLMSQGAVIAAYTFASDTSATTFDPNVTAGDFDPFSTFGGGRSSSQHMFARTNVTTGSTTSFAAASGSDDYFTVTITPDAGFAMNLTSFEFDYGYSSTAVPNGNIRAYATTSEDNHANFFNGNADGYTTITNPAVTGPIFPNFKSLDLSDPAFQNISTAFEFRIYLSDSYNVNDLIHRIDNVELNGTVVAIPEPSSTALLGLGGLALILRRRR